MRFTFLAVSCVVLAGALAGCFETVQIVTVNPDGSGKLAFETQVSMPLDLMTGEDGKKPDPKEMSKKMLAELLAKSKGVDAWSDLSCDVAKEGQIRTKGVAYFSDLSKVEVESLVIKDSKWTKTDKGGVLELVMDKKESPSKVEPKKLTPAEIAEQIKARRAQYQQTRPLTASFMASLKIDVTYILPGKVEEVSGFTKTETGGVRMVVEGKKMLELMDKVMADDKLLTEAIVAGKDPIREGPGEQMVREGLFGTKGPVKATVTGEMKPLFDYKAEMEKAKAAMPEMLKKLGVEMPASTAEKSSGASVEK